MGKSRKKPVQQLVKKDDPFLKPPVNPNIPVINNNNNNPNTNPNVGNNKERLLIAQKMESQYSGPIPPPGFMKAYEDAFPGSADRILTMAEEDSKHSREMEKLFLTAAIKQSMRGQWFAFIIGMTGILAGFTLIYLNKPTEGLVSIIGAIGILAAVYWDQNKKKGKEKEQTKQQKDNPPVNNNQNIKKSNK